MFKLRRYLRGHYLECVLAPTFKGLEAILQLIAPLVMAKIIDVGIANRDAGFVVSPRRRPGGHSPGLLRGGHRGAVLLVKAGEPTLAPGLRNDLFRHVLSLPREDVDALGRASLVTRITNDTQQAQDGLNMFFRLILRIPFVLVGSVVSAFLVDGWEAACLLASSVVAVGLILAFMRVTTRPLPQDPAGPGRGHPQDRREPRGRPRAAGLSPGGRREGHVCPGGRRRPRPCRWGRATSLAW